MSAVFETEAPSKDSHAAGLGPHHVEATETTLPAAAPGRQWWRALKAIGRLAMNTDDTTQVFEIIHALGGDNMERTFERVISLPEGQRLLRDKPSLNVLVGDHTRLAAMPDGSLGRAYLRFMLDGGITPAGLIDAQDAIRPTDRASRRSRPRPLLRPAPPRRDARSV